MILINHVLFLSPMHPPKSAVMISLYFQIHELFPVEVKIIPQNMKYQVFIGFESSVISIMYGNSDVIILIFTLHTCY